MLNEIDIEIILVSFLEKNDEASISDLLRVEERIKSSVPSITFDVSMTGILHAVEYYPRFFKWDSTRQVVTRAPEFEKEFTKFHVRKQFVSRIPSGLRKNVMHVLRA
jgi:hypothetical protein